MADRDPFPCAPFEFRSFSVVGEKQDFELAVVMDLRPSDTARNLRAAGHIRGKPEERLSRMGQAVLAGGVADIIAHFSAVAAKFPEVKGISVACSYSTIEAVLDDENQRALVGHYEYRIAPGGGTQTIYSPYWTTTTNTVVKDQASVETLTIAIPLAKIPATGDKEAVSKAVLSDGVIQDYKEIQDY